jgi:hypothetical protein
MGSVFWKCLRIIKDTNNKIISNDSGNVPDPKYSHLIYTLEI